MAIFGRVTVEECVSIDLAGLKQRGALRRGETMRLRCAYFRDADEVAEIVVDVDLSDNGRGDYLRISGTAYAQSINQEVALVAMPLHFGGHKWFAICPRTGRRCRRLILPPGAATFLSVRGWSRCYMSQLEDVFDRTHRAMRKIKARLASLSKYTRSHTRRRLKERLWELDMLLEQLVMEQIEQLEWSGSETPTRAR